MLSRLSLTNIVSHLTAPATHGLIILPLLITLSGLCMAADTITTPDNKPSTIADNKAGVQSGSNALEQTSLEDLKKSVLKLNRDLLILEEELLYPASNQLAVFVSVDVGEFFQLDAIKLKIDNQLSHSHLYTQRQLQALHKGGIQRFYIGNLKSGEHTISAFFTGTGPDGRDYKRAVDYPFTKSSEPILVELKIIDSTAKYQPEFVAKRWTVE